MALRKLAIGSRDVARLPQQTTTPAPEDSGVLEEGVMK
jgi:hypothetical protein